MDQNLLIGTTLVTLTDSAQKYAEIRNVYHQLAANGRQTFVSLFQRLKSVGDLYENGNTLAEQSFRPAFEHAIEELISAGIFDADIESFSNAYFEAIFSWPGVFEEVVTSKCESLVAHGEKQEQLRQLKAASKSRFVGGGFGIGGAVKGMALAGAANLVTGSFRGMMDGVSRASDEAKIRAALDEVFTSEDTLEQLADSVSEDIFRCHTALFTELAKHGIYDIAGMPSHDAKEKSQRLFDNLRSGRIPAAKTQEVLSSILENDPYTLEYYQLWIHILGDADGSVQQFAQAHHIDLSAMKAGILDDILAETDKNSIEALLQARARIEEESQRIGCPPDEALGRCNDDLHKATESAKTFEGTKYASIEEAALAKNEKTDIQSAIKACDPDSEESITATLNTLTRDNRVFVYANAQKLLTPLRDRLTELDIICRTFLDHEYPTRPAAQQAKAEYDEMAAAIEAHKDDLAALQKVAQQWETRSFTLHDAQEVLDVVNQRIAALDLESRTFAGRTFESAEQIASAQQAFEKYQDELRSILSQYKSTRDDSFFVHPDFIERKLSAFSQDVKTKFDHDLGESVFSAYYDDTTMGIGDRGMALIGQYLIITIKDIGILPIWEVNRFEMEKGFFAGSNIFLQYADQPEIKFEYKQAAKGVKHFIEVFNKIKSAMHVLPPELRH